MFDTPYSAPPVAQHVQDAEVLRIEARNLWNEILRFNALYDSITSQQARGDAALNAAREDKVAIVKLVNETSSSVGKLDVGKAVVGLSERYSVDGDNITRKSDVVKG